MVDEESAQQWPGHAGEREDGLDVAQIAAALARGDDVGDDGHGQRHHAARAQALEGPEGDQLAHVLGQTTQGRAGQKGHDRGQEDRLATIEVADLAPDRRGGGGGEQVSGDHPGQVVEATEVADDGGQSGRNDGLIEGAQQHREQEPAKCEQNLAPAELCSGFVLRRRFDTC